MKKAIVLMLALSLITFVGCSSDSDNSESNTVWKEYSNDYFGLKYPKGVPIEENNVDTDMHVNLDLDKDTSNDNAGIDIEFDKSSDTENSSIVTENDFDNFIQNTLNSISSSNDIKLINDENITIDGHKSHKIEIESNLESRSAIIVYIYYSSGQLCEINYFAKNSLFDSNKSLFNEILNSFQF